MVALARVDATGFWAERAPERSLDVSHASVAAPMLHCNMTTALNLRLGLEDLLADLQHARKRGDLGRLALIAYCEVRRWARDAGAVLLAEHASELITASPHVSREAFLEHIDNLILELEDAPRVVSSLRADKPDSGSMPTAQRGHAAR